MSNLLSRKEQAAIEEHKHKINIAKRDLRLITEKEKELDKALSEWRRADALKIINIIDNTLEYIANTLRQK